MNILADENIIYADAFFSTAGTESTPVQLTKKAGRQICRADLLAVDALLVRSVTQVNADLLANTPVKFVGTATIGTDHIDLAYLKENHIYFASAAGCSANTVAQYVLTATHALRPHYFHASTAQAVKLGIVGYGNIGKALAAFASMLGWQCMVYDPLVQITPTPQITPCTWQELLTQSHVLSLHVPLTHENTSAYPTHHLINKHSLAQIPADTLLINTARGKVVCEQDLLADIAKTNRQVVLDVFEHEPQLSAELVQSLAIATPHIAGYSLEGKARGTQYVYDTFCQWQNRTASLQFQTLLPSVQQIFKKTAVSVVDLTKALPNMYHIMADSAALKQSVLTSTTSKQQAQAFDNLRKEYALRREWQAYGLHTLRQS